MQAALHWILLSKGEVGRASGFFRGQNAYTYAPRTRFKMQNNKHVAVPTGVLHAKPQMLRARDRLL